MADKKYATEILDLPSQGWFYPEGNPLASGKVEIRYMGAKEEDILTSTNLVKRGVAIDMVLKSVLVSPVNYDDLLIGDKNALMIATRVLGYGHEYRVKVTCPSCEATQDDLVDLSKLNHKDVDVTQFPKGMNEFEFTLPTSNIVVRFRFLTSRDEAAIDAEIKAMRKVNDAYSSEMSTRLRKLLVSVDGKRDRESINKFVQDELIAVDSRALRSYLNKIQPGVDLRYNFVCRNPDCEYEGQIDVPMTIEFFWPGGER